LDNLLCACSSLDCVALPHVTLHATTLRRALVLRHVAAWLPTTYRVKLLLHLNILLFMLRDGVNRPAVDTPGLFPMSFLSEWACGGLVYILQIFVVLMGLPHWCQRRCAVVPFSTGAARWARCREVWLSLLIVLPVSTSASDRTLVGGCCFMPDFGMYIFSQD